MRRFVGLAAVPSVAALTVVAALAWFTVVAPDPTTVVAEVLRALATRRPRGLGRGTNGESG